MGCPHAHEHPPWTCDEIEGMWSAVWSAADQMFADMQRERDLGELAGCGGIGGMIQAQILAEVIEHADEVERQFIGGPRSEPMIGLLPCLGADTKIITRERGDGHDL